MSTGIRPRLGLVVFANSDGEWNSAARRIRSQANKSGFFKVVEIYNEAILAEIGTTYSYLSPEKFPRGYGLWSWKPLVLRKFVESNTDIDVILYLDAGCEIVANKNTAARLNFLVQTTMKYNFVAYQMPNIERNWTSAFVLEKLGVSDTDKDTGQIAATSFFMERNSALIFCDKWHQLISKDDFSLLIGEAGNPTASRSENPHRHDQSLLSILLKKEAKKYLLPSDEVALVENYKLSPIHWARNKKRRSIKWRILIRRTLNL